MKDAFNRSDRFELIAVCETDELVRFADEILEPDPPLRVLQEPTPQLLMQRVREPVERRAFNLGEVVVTPAEVELDGTRGFAMKPGKAERGAFSGAIVDAAVAAGHELSDRIVETLTAAGQERADDRARQWGESRHTTVEFETMEDEL